MNGGLFDGWLLHPSPNDTDPPTLTHDCPAPTHGRIGVATCAVAWRTPELPLSEIVQVALDHDRGTHVDTTPRLLDKTAFADEFVYVTELPRLLVGWHVNTMRYSTIPPVLRLRHELACCSAYVTYGHAPKLSVPLVRLVADASAHLSPSYHGGWPVDVLPPIDASTREGAR